MHHPHRDEFSQSIPVRTFLVVIGTRPEVIKLAPLIRRLRSTGWANVKIVTSGQQSDLLDQTLAEFGLAPDIAIRHRGTSHSPAQTASRLLSKLDSILENEPPDCVIAQGDTTTAYAASVGAFYRKTPFIHIEAGLRTPELDTPFPEEFHRRAIAVSTALHFAPTSAAAQNLIGENVPKDKVFVSGNTVIDSLLEIAATKPPPPPEFQARRTILLTAHRRENFGSRLRDALTAVKAFVDLTPDVGVYFPVHPNPNAREAAMEILAGHPRIHLVGPLNYRTMVAAIQNAWCVVTDSGGLQEEAPALAKPVLVLRDVTERPEAVASGVVELVGTSREAVFRSLYDLHKSPSKYARMARSVFPYGDGHASRRIIDVIYRHFVTCRDQTLATLVPLQHAP
ncbi:UDP-N-acetylglucosamine 2-epimerase (non-hydrolyzing) [Bradyrhizobium japonicum]|uniref:non-hydrolyzing UDP-N-acetylglucosamine 2-epimerase n=1 Tax=Bradyrhizobium japonicum TaxID=375 RepID=UPI001BABE8BB|nr:UDP-N-acetylglucosamine 2-epimerase (non-hydrolyzing) [Bradyrhizobium japonicum]MBR0994292.1 UDP-N-acetylglucosamine 2-epimerase (non-hydrolyzing) [Bradyrhizobium japonicum]